MNPSCCVEAQGPEALAQEICSQCDSSIPPSWIAQFEDVDPDFSEVICYKCASLLLVPKLKRESLKKLSGPFLKQVIECYSSQAQSKVLFANQPPEATELAYDFILNSCHTIPEFRMRLYKENWSTILDAQLYLESVKGLISMYALEGYMYVPRFKVTVDGLRRASIKPVRSPPTLSFPLPPQVHLRSSFSLGSTGFIRPA
ncbi:hypothetical protein DSO57_1012160 [Entomophthora muscae]|uniref:Uncharacterized protein n=1 Tax=Entomophthora muscae TaxID=34485 RepID=A0ACC2SVG1_9FUNG|nr:hypothetical protein DSO57_1012160 [Entomophthora muscae]